MKIKQNVASLDHRAKDIVQLRLVSLWLLHRQEKAVEVALDETLAGFMGAGIGDGNENHMPAREAELAGIQFPHHAEDGVRPASFVAVDGAENEKTRARFFGGIGEGPDHLV